MATARNISSRSPLSLLVVVVLLATAVLAHGKRFTQVPYSIAAASTTTTTITRSHLPFFVPQRSSRISVLLSQDALLKIRGGFSDNHQEENEEESDDTDDNEEEEEAVVEEEVAEEDEDDEEEEEEEEEVDTALVTSIKPKKKKKDAASEYDEPYSMSISMMMYSTFVPILLSRKVDLYQPAIVWTLR
jgi:hypothetical protein